MEFGMNWLNHIISQHFHGVGSTFVTYQSWETFSFSQVTFINNDFSLKSITNYVRSPWASWYIKITDDEVCINVIYMRSPYNKGKKRMSTTANPLHITQWNRYDPTRTQSYVHSIKIIKRWVSIQCVIDKLMLILHWHCCVFRPNPMK